MNRLLTVFSLVILFSVQFLAQTFTRTFTFKDPSGLERGFGGIVAGVDFDKDGKPEIYACNTNMVDGPYELIPRLYKFEWNGTSWDSVWSTIAPVPLQNTWPALTWGDLDGDGKPEIIWGIVNNLDAALNPNPARVLVYEYPGDGSDNMGVSDGFGGFLPNAKTNFNLPDNFNMRPIRFVVSDVDSDGKRELIFCDRQSSSDYHVGVWSVNTIPDNGDGSEIWTEEFKGLGDPNLTGTGSDYDLTVVGNVIGLWGGDGRIAMAKYTNNVWTTSPPQSGVADMAASFKGSVVADMDHDGSSYVVVGGWYNAKVYLIDKPGNVDTLVSYEIADFAPFGAVRLNGAGVGDLDNDGNTDFVFGTRYMATQGHNNLILRLEYLGGDKKNPASYEASVLDSALFSKGGDMDVVTVANIDGDPEDEVLYTQGYSRGNANDTPMPIAVVELKHTEVNVERETSPVPSSFFVDQNFPNPFNPSTSIRFGIVKASPVTLKVYDMLGKEIATLLQNEVLESGTYTAHFDAGKLASGIYLYRLSAGESVTVKKMQLLK